MPAPASDPDNDVLVCLTALPNADRALALADALVGESLAACVNVIDGAHSVYFWQGAVVREREALCLVKTTRGRFDALQRRILELHPYQLPEVVAITVADGHAPYLEWVRAFGRT